METSKVFVLDGGNTHIKLGTFEGHQLLQTQRFQERTALGNLLKSTDKVVVANVGELQLQQDLIDMGCQVYTVSNLSLLPFTNAYKTPSTLGSQVSRQRRHPKKYLRFYRHPHRPVEICSPPNCFRLRGQRTSS